MNYRPLVSTVKSLDFKTTVPGPDDLCLSFLPDSAGNHLSTGGRLSPNSIIMSAPDDLSELSNMLASTFSNLAANLEPEQQKLVSDLISKKFAETGGE